MEDIVIIQRDMKRLLEGLEKLGKELEIQEEKIKGLEKLGKELEIQEEKIKGLEKLGKELEIQEEKIMWLIEQLDTLHGC